LSIGAYTKKITRTKLTDGLFKKNMPSLAGYAIYELYDKVDLHFYWVDINTCYYRHSKMVPVIR